jgi:hypothetical protein
VRRSDPPELVEALRSTLDGGKATTVPEMIGDGKA